jgi:hypothetical protein
MQLRVSEHLDEEEMTKLIALASADDNYVCLEISRIHHEHPYSVLALVFDKDDVCIECFHPTLAYTSTYEPLGLTHVLRAELECRGLNVMTGINTSIFDENIETSENNYLCDHHLTLEALDEALGVVTGSVH